MMFLADRRAAILITQPAMAGNAGPLLSITAREPDSIADVEMLRLLEPPCKAAADDRSMGLVVAERVRVYMSVAIEAFFVKE